MPFPVGEGLLARLRRRRGPVLAWGVPLLFFVLGLVVFGHDVGHPDVEVFDEAHYLKAGRAFANGTWMNPDWGEPRPQNFEHPPLAKYWIASSIHLFGDEPTSWRLPAVLYGALGLAGMSVLGRRLFGSHWAGALAPTLLFLDPMWYVHSRLALLEIYVAAPMVWAFALALGARRWEHWGAGVVAGIGLAGKFNAVFLLPVLFLVFLWRALPVRRLGPAVGVAAGFGLGVPAAVYFLSHAPFLWEWTWREGPLWAVQHWAWLFKESLVWGAGGPQEHPEVSAPLYWIPMVRPTWYFVEWGQGEGLDQVVRLIYAIGNPVVWWGGLVFAAIVLFAPTLRLVRGLAVVAPAGEEEGRPVVAARFFVEDRQRWGSMGLALLIFLAAYLPNFLLARVTFLYYFSLASPYLALMAGGGLAMLLAKARRDRPSPEGVGAVPDPEEGVSGPAGGERVELGAVPWDLAPLEAAEDAPQGVGHMESGVPEGPEARPEAGLGGGDRPKGEPPWLLSLFWKSAWPERVAVLVFLVAAAWMSWEWRPLYTGEPFVRATIEEAWDLVPWMERLISDV